MHDFPGLPLNLKKIKVLVKSNSGGNGLIIGYRWIQQNLFNIRPSVPGGIEVASMYVAGFNLGYFAALGIRKQVER
jgi:hypothetical protein